MIIKPKITSRIIETSALGNGDVNYKLSFTFADLNDPFYFNKDWNFPWNY